LSKPPKRTDSAKRADGVRANQEKSPSVKTAAGEHPLLRRYQAALDDVQTVERRRLNTREKTTLAVDLLHRHQLHISAVSVRHIIGVGSLSTISEAISARRHEATAPLAAALTDTVYLAALRLQESIGKELETKSSTALKEALIVVESLHGKLAAEQERTRTTEFQRDKLSDQLTAIRKDRDSLKSSLNEALGTLKSDIARNIAKIINTERRGGKTPVPTLKRDGKIRASAAEPRATNHARSKRP